MKILLLDFSPKAMEGNCASMAQFLMKAYPMHTYTLVHVAKEGIEPCGQCQYRLFGWTGTMHVSVRMPVGVFMG